MPNTDIASIWNEACAAARQSTVGAHDGYPCGFAWLLIKPGRGKLVSFLKANKIGRSDAGGMWGGYIVSASQLDGWCGQNMLVKEESVRAAAVVLRKHGFNCHMVSRID